MIYNGYPNEISHDFEFCSLVVFIVIVFYFYFNYSGAVGNGDDFPEVSIVSLNVDFDYLIIDIYNFYNNDLWK